jgi:DHA1 family tetracycline resistance protein-like MFS transporter
MASTRAAFAFVYVTVVLDMLALGVMVPVLPKLIVQLDGGDLAQAAQVTGVFSLAWAAVQLFAAPVLGSLSDRYGRRPVILLSNLGLGLDYLLMAVAPSLPWLFLGRIISGLTAASFPTAGAYVADVTPEGERAARFGLLGSAFGLGFIIGPAVGGLLGAVDLRLPFWVAAALSLANFAYGLFILPESLPAERRSPFRWQLANPLGSIGFLRSHPGLLGFALASGLGYLAHDALPSVFVLYADHRYGWDEATVGGVLAAVGVCSTIVSAVLVGPAVQRLGERGALLTGIACGTLGFAAYGLAPSGAYFLIGVPLTALWGIGGPAMSAIMSRRVGPEGQGKLQGALGSLHGLTGMAAPILFTQVFAATLGERPVLPFVGTPFLLAAMLLAGSLGLMAWTTGRRQFGVR